jgi:hypothetical protein
MRRIGGQAQERDEMRRRHAEARKHAGAHPDAGTAAGAQGEGHDQQNRETDRAENEDRADAERHRRIEEEGRELQQPKDGAEHRCTGPAPRTRGRSWRFYQFARRGHSCRDLAHSHL